MLILTLRAAKHSAWSACKKGFRTMFATFDRVFAVCHSKCHHHTVILYVPHGFHATLYHIRIVKRKEQMQIILSGHGFFFDKVIFRQINCFVVHKCWCGRQSCHKTKQTILYCKLTNSFFYLLWSFDL